MNRQQIWTDETGEVVDLVRGKSTLFSSCFQPLDQGYVEYVSQVAHSGFDIIQVEFYELLSLGFLLPENVQTIFVHHELRYIRNEKEIALFREQTAGDRMLFHIAKDFERSALLKYKDVIVLTEVDRKIMEDFIGRKDHIYTSPAVVQVGDRLEQPFVPVQSGRLTFVGSEDHFPNLDAVAWFCHEVIPHPLPSLQKVLLTIQHLIFSYAYHYRYVLEQQQHCLLKKSPDLPHSLPASIPGIRTAND